MKSNSRVLATTEKHLPVCQIVDKEYLKNGNRMMVKYNLKHKVKEFHVGNCVTVRIPRIDQFSTDPMTAVHNCTGDWNGMCNVPLAVQVRGVE